MQAIILNSGMGSRLGKYTEHNPKCMVRLNKSETILSYQLRLLKKHHITNVLISTGYMADMLSKYVDALDLGISVSYTYNPEFRTSNYITSLNLIETNDDVLLFHGDLVFSDEVLEMVLCHGPNVIVTDSAIPLPEKDFKARLMNGRVKTIGINLFGKDCVAAQPLYYLSAQDWNRWKQEIRLFCQKGNIGVYAEEALNGITDNLELLSLDINGRLCSEIDTIEDLKGMQQKMDREIYHE